MISFYRVQPWLKGLWVLLLESRAGGLPNILERHPWSTSRKAFPTPNQSKPWHKLCFRVTGSLLSWILLVYKLIFLCDLICTQWCSWEDLELAHSSWKSCALYFLGSLLCNLRKSELFYQLVLSQFSQTDNSLLKYEGFISSHNTYSWNYGIREHPELEGTQTRMMESSSWLCTGVPQKSHPVLESIVWMLLELWQVWSLKPSKYFELQ